jgi:hypothetical protein
MSFLLAMLSLLVTTFISIVLNFDCWENATIPRDSGFFFQTLYLPQSFYSRVCVELL